MGQKTALKLIKEHGTVEGVINAVKAKVLNCHATSLLLCES